jgi:hypothetical protein
MIRAVSKINVDKIAPVRERANPIAVISFFTFSSFENRRCHTGAGRLDLLKTLNHHQAHNTEITSHRMIAFITSINPVEQQYIR